MVEELLAWLTEAYVLLSTKEKDPIPDDLNTVETLYKEHVVSFHFNIFCQASCFHCSCHYIAEILLTLKNITHIEFFLNLKLTAKAINKNAFDQLNVELESLAIV